MPHLFLLWGMLVLMQLTWWSSVPGHLSFLWALLIAVIPCILVYVYARRKGGAVVRRWAPDRVTLESDRLVGHYDGRTGPGNASTVAIPFGAITEIRVQSHLTQVNTIWGKSSAKAIYDSPPTVPDRSGAPMTAAAVMMLTPENGQKVNSVWNAWRFPAQQAGMACPRCGRPVPAGVQFCPSCSTRIDAQPQPVRYNAPSPTPAPTRTYGAPVAQAQAQPRVGVGGGTALRSTSTGVQARPPPAPPRSNPTCPQCKGEATFIPQYGQSYCYTCSTYV